MYAYALLATLWFPLDVVVVVIGTVVLITGAGHAKAIGVANLIGAGLVFVLGCGLLPDKLTDPLNRPAEIVAWLAVLGLMPGWQVFLATRFYGNPATYRAVVVGLLALACWWGVWGWGVLQALPRREWRGRSLPDLRALGTPFERNILQLNSELSAGRYSGCWWLLSDAVPGEKVRPQPEFRRVEQLCVDRLIRRLTTDHPLEDDAQAPDYFSEIAASTRFAMLRLPLDADLRAQLLATPLRPSDPHWATVAEGRLAVVDIEKSVYRRDPNLYVHLRVFNPTEQEIAVDLRADAGYARPHPENPGTTGATQADPLSEGEATQVLRAYTQGQLLPGTVSGSGAIRWYQAFQLPLAAGTSPDAGALVVSGQLHATDGTTSERIGVLEGGAFTLPPPSEWKPLLASSEPILPPAR